MKFLETLVNYKILTNYIKYQLIIISLIVTNDKFVKKKGV